MSQSFIALLIFSSVIFVIGVLIFKAFHNTQINKYLPVQMGFWKKEVASLPGGALNLGPQWANLSPARKLRPKEGGP